MQKTVERTSGTARQLERHSITEINTMGEEEFVRLVGPVFEGSPWIARRAWPNRPFDSLEALHRALCRTLEEASETEQIQLIQAHPDLAGQAAQAGRLTAESAREQAGAGLNTLTAAESALFESYNRRYWGKFHFPFVVCARLNRKEAMLEGFNRRLNHDRAEEIQIALKEIGKIAELRLRDLISSPPGRLTTHVLDTAHGCPARDMQIELWALSGEEKTLIKRARTTADGRTEEPLAMGGTLVPGQYELVFFVGDYFEGFAPGTARFLDQVPVRFGITEAGAAYHVPLLCSPWAYSTYRGS